VGRRFGERASTSLRNPARSAFARQNLVFCGHSGRFAHTPQAARPRQARRKHRKNDAELASPPLKCRVLRLQLAAARPAPISAACALRHDPLQAQLARLSEHDRALGLQGFAEHDVVGAGDQSRQLMSALLERALTERSSPLRFRRSKATRQAPAPPALVRSARSRSTHRDEIRPPRRRSGRVLLPGRSPTRRSSFVGEICAVTAPKRTLALLSGDDPVAIMFHLVQPLRPRGRPGD